MSQLQNFWRIITPASRRQLYTTISTDAYDPRTTDLSSLTSVQWYSQVLRGLGTRSSSYKQYDAMDTDIDIARSLDIIAEEMSGKDEKTQLPFEITYQKEDNEDISDTTVVTLRQALRQWSNTQDFQKRIFTIARCQIKYGDCFFRKLSDTKKWTDVDPSTVHGIEIDQLGNKIAYHIKKPSTALQYGVKTEQMEIVPAAAMIHFTLSDDMGDSAPFGQSILRSVHRVYKQLAMLEDAVIIYRIVRAPERRVFYIDVGNMPPQRVKQYLNQVQMEMKQKRTPGQNGGKDIVDGQYDAQCLALDTQVPLLDGRTLTIAELAKEHQDGKQNWVYSCDPVTGAVAPGEITWAGVTRKNAEVIRLTLDNGETITCTPDHRFPIQGRGFIHARNLTADMSLVPFMQRWMNGDGVISEIKVHGGYEEFYDVLLKKWIKTHQLVSSTMDLPVLRFNPNCHERPCITHHVDFNKHNNNPENLVMMGLKDHFALHSAHNKDRWETWTPERQQEQVRSLHEGRKQWLAEMSLSERAEYESRREQIRTRNFRDRGVPEYQRRFSSRGASVAQRLQVSSEMLLACLDLIKANPKVPRKGFIARLQQHEPFLKAFSAANTPTKTGRRSKPTWTTLEVMQEQLNANNFADFKQKLQLLNHRVVKIEYLSERQDTGCITVGEKLHKNHTFSLAAGVFCANSISEDILMPVTAAGRGSRVETLPGGTEDFGTALIKQFQDKIFRGLRIPTSYMTGVDGAQAQYNDGKVGIAYIEELRFAQFIRRMQDRLDEIFDQEFKIYLKVVGLKIDDEIFKIKLPDPANFALYRQAALDADLIGSYNNIAPDKTLSVRFKQKRYLGLTDDEIQMNEALIKEERGILENANIPPVQQIYDEAVFGNREAITVEAAAPPEEGAPAGEIAGAGEEPGFFAGGGEEAAPPAETGAPEATPAPETAPEAAVA